MENFGYRQLTVWWRLHGIVESVFHRRDWGKAERNKFDGSEEKAAAPESLTGPNEKKQRDS
jgi:hypothetical protein